LKLCYNVFILENKIDVPVFKKFVSICVNLCYSTKKIPLICVNMERISSSDSMSGQSLTLHWHLCVGLM
jgi:hypothetical protein